MLKKIKADRTENNHQWSLIILVILCVGVGLYFLFKPEMTMQDLANFVQLPILVAIAANTIISIKNYNKLVESEIQKTSETYNRLVENRINKIDQLFMGNKKLDRLYQEMYPELKPKELSSKKPSHREIRMEHTACSIIFQFMSEIFTQMQTETPYPITRHNLPQILQTQKGQDFLEWLQTFAKWTRSPTLRRHWKYFKDEHHPEFTRFVSEFYLGVGDSLSPITPGGT